MKKITWKSILIGWGAALAGVLWFFGKMAMAWRPGVTLDEWAGNLTATLKRPFDFSWNEAMPVFLWIGTIIWLIVFAGKLTRTGNWRPGAEHGRADWAVAKKLRKIYEQCENIKLDNKEVIYDQNIIISQNMRLGLDAKKHGLNLNQVVVGGAGTGKSTGLVMPNLMQCNSSYTVIDPSGELYSMCGGLLQMRGYEVRCLNLVDMCRSHRFNPFVYIKESKDIRELAASFIENTKEEGAGKGEQIWVDGMRLLLESLIAFLWEAVPERQRTFQKLTELTMLGKLGGDSMGTKSDLDMLFEDWGADNPGSLAWKNYQLFCQAPPKTRASMAISLTTRLSVFNIPEVADLVCEDELHLDRLGDKKTALFCVIPQAENSYNFLIGMMYTALFLALYHRGKARGEKRGDGTVELDIPVQVYMDEFANSARPNMFENILATCRKYLISICIFLQGMSQLKALYEKSWEGIVGNCDTFIYLGGNERSTWQYISESLGKATINIQTSGKSGNNFNTNQQLAGRELELPDEVRMLHKRQAIIMMRGERPIKDWKYNLKKHPNVRHTLRGGAAAFTQEFVHDEWDAMTALDKIMEGFTYEDSGAGSYADKDDEIAA